MQIIYNNVNLNKSNCCCMFFNLKQLMPGQGKTGDWSNLQGVYEIRDDMQEQIWKVHWIMLLNIIKGATFCFKIQGSLKLL